MGIIQFSKTIKYKILVWSLVGACVLFLFIGVILVIVDSGNTKPREMTINLTSSSVNDVYNLDVYKKQTPIIVNTTPNTNSPVRLTFLSGSDCASITDVIYPGGIAILSLKEDSSNNGAFRYGRDDIKISIDCGGLHAQLNVRIRVPKEQVSFSMELFNGRDAEITISAEEYFSETYGSASPLIYSRYSFTPRLKIWDTVIGTNFLKIAETSTPGYLYDSGTKTEIREACVGGDYGIRLFSKADFEGVYIPSDFLQLVMSLPSKTVSLRFAVMAKYLEEEYIDYYTLTIVE